MAKINKLALVRLALRCTVEELSREEKLRVLADMYAPPLRDGVHWNGGPNAEGSQALDQGIYFSVTKLRIVADLWLKLRALGAQLDEERKIVRDALFNSLPEEDRHEVLDGRSVPQVDDDIPDVPQPKRDPQPAERQGQLKLAVNSAPSKFAPPDPDPTGYSL